MLAEEWVQYVSPFLGPDVSRADAADVFTQLLGSRFFVSLGASLDLEQLQAFTLPNVEKLLEGMTPEEACRTVAQAAQDEAIRAADPQKRPELAVDRLASLVEQRHREMRANGELVLATEVERVRAEEAHKTAQLAESNSEKDAEIVALRSKLQETETSLERAQAHNRWSVSMQFTRLRSSARNALHHMIAWPRAHKVRLGIRLGLVAIALTVQLEDWFGWFGRIGGWGGVIALIAADTEVVKRNLRRFWHPE
jgi:hypothetical protein